VSTAQRDIRRKKRVLEYAERRGHPAADEEAPLGFGLERCRGQLSDGPPLVCTA
jgi:hypothetical protein